MRRLLPLSVCSLVALLGFVCLGTDSTATASIRTASVKAASVKAASVKAASVKAASVKAASVKAASVKAASVKAASVKAQAAAKKTTTTKKKATTTKKKAVTTKKATTKTTAPRVSVAKTVPTIAVDTTPASPLPTGVPVTVPVTEAVGNPGATDSTLAGATTTIHRATTTLAPYPAAANPPTRATAASLDPYRGLGTWVDAFDWTVQKGGKTPRVSAATVDAMAAAGVQTLYIQATRYDTADVAEPERLIPIINRAHELGLYVVVWYLPTFTDVNADLRRTVAIANLDIDGISIDIEARNVANVAERNRRLISYSQSLRTLLPGRFISNNIVQPNILDAVPNMWPTEYGKGPAGITSYWTPFPYVEIAPFYDFWMIQNYWTQRSTGGGWRDAYKISIDNATRLRATLGRPDLPVHLIGGVGDRPLTTNDLAGMIQANREMGGIGLSFYDWLVTPKTWWPTFWNARYTAPGQAPDARFVPVAPPVYTAPSQPVLLPPTTTIPAPTVPPTVAAAPTVAVPAPTAAPTVPPTAAPTVPSAAPTSPPGPVIIIG